MSKKELITGAEFARRAGVSKQIVGKLCTIGTLVKEENGLMDPEHPTNAAYLDYKTDPDVRATATKHPHSKGEKIPTITGKKKVPKKKASPKKSARKKTAKKKPEPDPLEVQDSLQNFGQPKNQQLSLADVQDITTLSRPDLERLKIIEAIESSRIKTEQQRSELISRSLVSRVFAKIHSVDANELKNLGLNVTPEIAAVTGNDNPEVITKINEIIDKEVYSILNHVKRIIDDFLNEIGREKN